jgi:hypothetical protein
MVDYYGLPQVGERAWPGRAAATLLPASRKPLHVEAALLADLAADIDHRRFLPFVVMHEFEGLLFSDCGVFAKSIGKAPLEAALREIRDGFDTPEEINDSPDTAPSKRVEDLIPEYQKPLFGNVAASAIGLAKISAECPHFRMWIAALEAVAR